MRHINIFDLDGTVIDSSKRVVPCLKANGDLDLQMYIDTACSPEKVSLDTLLPLADYMKQLINRGETVCVVTARYMNACDYVYLRKHGLQKSNVIICSRDRLAGVFGKQEGKRISALSDGEYKRSWFNHLWHSLPNNRFTMYDDHQGVLAVCQEMAGFTGIDAVAINSMINDAFVAGIAEGEDYSDFVFNSVLDDLGIGINI